MTTTIKNFPEILHFHRYTKRPVDYFNRPSRNIDIYIPFVNVISISKHKTHYHKYNLSYYCVLLRNGTRIYINHKVFSTDGIGAVGYMDISLDYVWLERLLNPSI